VLFILSSARLSSRKISSLTGLRKTHLKNSILALAKNLSTGVYFQENIFGREVDLVEQSSFPKCQKCNTGDLVPLSDFGSQGASLHYKAWVCTNPDCGFNLKIRNGDIYLNEPIMSGVGGTRSRQNT
jgi:hypothetical protein